MPRIVNHDARRQEIARAAWRVIRRDGLERASLRTIAKEAGCTTGVLTHYFRDKDQLMLFTLDGTMGDVVGRVTGALGLKVGRARFEAWADALADLLPSTRSDGWRAWFAFLGRAFNHSGLLAEQRHRYARYRAVLVDQLRHFVAERVIRADIDVDVAADHIMAMIDGLGIGTVVDPGRFTPAWRRRLLRDHLEGLLVTPKPGAAGRKRRKPLAK